MSTVECAEDKEFRLSGVALSRAGQELSMVVEPEPMDEYAEVLTEFFEKNKLRMTEVDSWQPQHIDLQI